MSNRHNDPGRSGDSDDGFDRAMRERYLHATQNVSASTRERLRADRHAAARGDRLPVRGWPMGAVYGGLAATAFAAALGLNLNAPGPDEGFARPGNTMATVGDARGVTALDNDPDFYAWLASADAQLLAME